MNPRWISTMSHNNYSLMYYGKLHCSRQCLAVIWWDYPSCGAGRGLKGPCITVTVMLRTPFKPYRYWILSGGKLAILVRLPFIPSWDLGCGLLMCS
jgi:hypothetical protein